MTRKAYPKRRPRSLIDKAKTAAYERSEETLRLVERGLDRGEIFLDDDEPLGLVVTRTREIALKARELGLVVQQQRADGRVRYVVTDAGRQALHRLNESSGSDGT